MMGIGSRASQESETPIVVVSLQRPSRLGSRVPVPLRSEAPPIAQLHEVLARVRASDAAIGIVLETQAQLLSRPGAEAATDRQVITEVQPCAEALLAAVVFRRQQVDADRAFEEPRRALGPETEHRRDAELRQPGVAAARLALPV